MGTAEMQLLSVSGSRGSGATSPRLSSSSCSGVGSSPRAHHSADATPPTATTTTTSTAAAAAVAAAGADVASSSSDSNSDWDEWSDTEQTVSAVRCVDQAANISGPHPFLWSPTCSGVS